MKNIFEVWDYKPCP